MAEVSLAKLFKKEERGLIFAWFDQFQRDLPGPGAYLVYLGEFFNSGPCWVLAETN